jgi:hypothetical protein
MKFSMTGQTKVIFLIQVTAFAGLALYYYIRWYYDGPNRVDRCLTTISKVFIHSRTFNSF